MASMKLLLLVFTVISLSATSCEETYPQLLFSYRVAIGLFDTKTENITILGNGYDHVLYLDYHSSNHYIFWSDYHIGTISRLQYRGRKKTAQVIITGANNPTGVAVDNINDHLYWAELGGDRIHRAHLNGSSTKFSIDVPSPTGLALDISNRLVYCVNTQGEAFKCTMDGGECQTIYTSNHRFDNLAIDLAESKIYWTAWYYSLPIQSSYLNGSNVQRTNITISQAWGIDVSSTHLYYADWNKGLCKMKKTNSTYYILLHAHAKLTALKIFKLEANSPTDIAPVNVDAELIEGKSFQIPIHDNQVYSSLLPVFRCRFADVSEGSYVYDVHWYINGVSVKSHLNVPFSNINVTVLRDADWINKFRMNMEVKCAIRMRYSTDSTPGSLLYSQSYKAGIFPAKYEYTVNEGESIDITFTATVPVGCISSHDEVRAHCEQNFYIYQQMDDRISVLCRNKNAKKYIIFESQFCGISIKSLHWKSETILRVHGFSDSIYNFQDRSTVLKISTIAVSESNYIWRDVQVPDIKVTVKDKDYILIDRQCMSYNDPHITTFDGRLYHYMNVGEFVMYKNDKGPYSVHALFTNCGFGWAGSSCHCGIAVRSRNSLFVLRTCQTISRTQKHLLQEPHIKLIRCDKKDLVIEHDTNNYKITLPTGTEIKFTISRWSKFISMIAIKPSIFDINEARGLCGVPSTTKDQSDDFTHRYNGPINNDQAFADSWRITPTMVGEQLFCIETHNNSDDEIGNNVAEINSTRYCTCERQATITLDDFNTVQCNLTDITVFCSEAITTEEEMITPFYTSCSAFQRQTQSVNSVDKIKRRNIIEDNEVIDISCFTYDESVSTEVTIPDSCRSGWTEKIAWQTCMDEIQKALPPELVDLVDVSVDEFVESCVLDIKLVGDTTFLSDTIGTMLTYIMTEILRNESLYFLNTTEGSQTLVEYVTSFICPNNCSENGNCTMGACQCNGNYIGDDCSQTITIPPSYSLPFDGLCTPETRDCRNPNIFGNFLSKTVWYNIKHFQKVTDSIKYIPEDDVRQAHFRNIFMVSIDLMPSRSNRTTTETIVAEGYEISLSYDGTNFGESVSIIIYDAKCYSCNSSSIACFEQDLCNPTVSPTTNNDNPSFVLIAAASGGMLLVIILVIVCLYCRVKSNMTRTKNDATPDKLEGKPGLYLDQSIDSRVGVTRDTTLSDLKLEIDDRRSETPFEMFENQLPPESPNKLNLEN